MPATPKAHTNPMRLVKFILFSGICLACAMIGILLVVSNPQSVALNLIIVSLPELNLVFWLLIFLILGALMGYSYSTLRSWLKPSKSSQK